MHYSSFKHSHVKRPPISNAKLNGQQVVSYTLESTVSTQDRIGFVLTFLTV